MRNPSLKLVNKIKDSNLFANILVWLQRSKIQFKNEDQLLQSIGLANVRIGMAQAHIFIEDKTEAHRQLRNYLLLGANHRILLDCFWVMQARGDEAIIIGDETETDSLVYTMKKMTGIGIDATKKIVLDGVKFKIFKRIVYEKDRRTYTYEINDSDDLIQAYIEWGNTNLGITANLYKHIFQGSWDEETQAEFLKRVGFLGTPSDLLTRKQEIMINKYWGRGAIFEPREN